MAEIVENVEIFNGMDRLKKSVQNFSMQFSETKRLLWKKKESFERMIEKLNMSGMKNQIQDQNIFISYLKKENLKMDIGEPIQDTHIFERVTKLDYEIKKISSQVETAERELQAKKMSFQMKLKEIEKTQADFQAKVSQVDEWDSDLRAILQRAPVSVSLKGGEPICKPVKTQEMTYFLDIWFEFEKTTINCLNDAELLAKTMGEQVDSESSGLERKITNWEKELERIVNDKNELMQILKDFKDLEADSAKSQKIKDLEEENQGLKKSLQKMKEEFESQLKQENSKVKKEEERLGLLQSENERYLAEVEKNKEEIRKRDKLLEEKDTVLFERDCEITELKGDLEKLIKEKNDQVQTEKELVRKIQERDLRIEELQRNMDGLMGAVNEILNKISDSNHKESQQDENWQVKEEESDLENRSLKNKIVEVQQKLEKAVFMAQKTEHQLIGNDSESLVDEDLVSTLRAQIAKKDAELEKLQTSLGSNYVTRKDYHEDMRKMQGMIEKFVIKQEKDDKSLNVFHQQSQKQFEGLTRSDDRKLIELDLNFGKDDDLTKLKRKDCCLSKVSGSHSVNGKRNIEDLLASSEESYGKKSASKLNNEKENLRGLSEKPLSQEKNTKSKDPITITNDNDDEDLGGVGEIMKKIKQE